MKSAAASWPMTRTNAEQIKGRSSSDAAQILGISGRAEMIHRDDLVVGGPRGTDSAK